MAPAAYGAFIVHPPVLVGLALAAQPLPLPAELKFILVFGAAVAASFCLAAVPGRLRRPIGRGETLGAPHRPATVSGVRSAMESSTRSATARPRSAGGCAGLGIAITRIPAASADSSPFVESSIATQRSGDTPRRRAASR